MSKQAVKSRVHDPEPRLPELNARMRARRSQLGLTGAELAERAGISPSYIARIENGAKVPDEDVAAQIARALGDDEDLYRAWARAARLGPRRLGLLTRLEAASRTPAFASLVESGQALPSLAESAGAEGELAERMREVARRLSSPSAVEAPSPSGSPAVASIAVFGAGADPAAIDEPAADRLLLDRRLLRGAAPARLFALVVGDGDTRHLRGVAQPGDHVVFDRGRPPTPERISAVRVGRRLVMSRVLQSGGSLLLLPGDGETGFESVELGNGRTPAEVVAGTHVLLIRS
jgi:transcriptional regulator with XRE-family HTH domain